MLYPNDPAALSRYTPEQRQALLQQVHDNPPRGRWRIVIVPLNETEDRRMAVKRMKSEGKTMTAIAKELGVSLSLVSRILKGTR